MGPALRHPGHLGPGLRRRLPPPVHPAPRAATRALDPPAQGPACDVAPPSGNRGRAGRAPGEYRAIPRNLLPLGGNITCAPAAITVTLDTPAPPGSHALSRCSWMRSTPPRPACPVITGLSPTGSVSLATTDR